MTLYELVNDIEVQGAVRVSCFCGENMDEKILYEGGTLDGIGTGDLEDGWEDREVTYLFCQDGVLHIEVEGE